MACADINVLYTDGLRLKLSFFKNLTFYKRCGTKVAQCILLEGLVEGKFNAE